MARIKERERERERESEAEELRAELALLLERSRVLLAEESELENIGRLGESSTDWHDDESLDDLSGIELVFEEGEGSREAEEDLGPPTPDDGGVVRQAAGSNLLITAERSFSRNPLPWVAGAVVLGVIGARWLSKPIPSKNQREKASQIGGFPLTHGSLPGTIMKTGFELASPVLFEVSKKWVSRIVENRR